MLYAGIDVHRSSSYVSVIDEKGNRVAQRNLPSELEAIVGFLGGLPEEPAIVMESTSAWCWLYDGLTERGYAVVASDPRKTKAIASARIKNDKLDAHMLAQLLRADLVATVYVSPPESAPLPSYHRRPVDSCLALLDQLEAQIGLLDQEVKERAEQDPQAQLLMTLPGVGPLVAMIFLAEVGDIKRFKSHRQLAAYVGMVPCLDSSAGKNRLGHKTDYQGWLQEGHRGHGAQAAAVCLLRAP